MSTGEPTNNDSPTQNTGHIGSKIEEIEQSLKAQEIINTLLQNRIHKLIEFLVTKELMTAEEALRFSIGEITEGLDAVKSMIDEEINKESSDEV